MKKRTYDLEAKLLEYSVQIIKIVEQLPNTKAGNHVAGQLLRSGTSPYPNHGEAQAAESPKDFIHKLRISLLDVCFSFDVGRSMFDVRRSSLKTKPYGINATCECLQNNLALVWRDYPRPHHVLVAPQGRNRENDHTIFRKYRKTTRILRRKQ